MEIKRGIDKAVESVIGELKEARQAHPGQEGHRAGRYISANGDTTIRNIIADAMDKVGKEGVITVERGEGPRDDAGRGRGHAVSNRGLPSRRTS